MKCMKSEKELYDIAQEIKKLMTAEWYHKMFYGYREDDYTEEMLRDLLDLYDLTEEERTEVIKILFNIM